MIRMALCARNAGRGCFLISSQLFLESGWDVVYVGRDSKFEKNGFQWSCD